VDDDSGGPVIVDDFDGGIASEQGLQSRAQHRTANTHVNTHYRQVYQKVPPARAPPAGGAAPDAAYPCDHARGRA
jgi:hypothetical protein